jgi:class 3 adenylate cyclase
MIRALIWPYRRAILALLTLGGVVACGGESKRPDAGVRGDAGQISITHEDVKTELTSRFEYYEDTTATLNLDGIRRVLASGKFAPDPSGEFSRGFSDSAFWIHGVLTNRTHREAWYFVLDYPLLDEIDIFVKRSDGRIKRMRAGESRPHSERPLDTRLFVFPMDLEHREIVDVLVRVQTDGACQTRFQLWPTEAFLEHEGHMAWFLGLYYGALLMLSLYNILLFFYFRRMAFLTLAGMVLLCAMWLATLDGLIYQHLWPDSPAWNALAATACLLALALNGFVLIRMFLEDFLPPKTNHIIELMIACAVAFLVAGFFVPYDVAIRMGMAMVLLYFPTNLIFGSLALHTKEPRARSFFAAAVCVAIGGLLTTGFIVGWFPGVPATRYAAPIAIAVMAALLSVSLSDEIGTVKRHGESLRNSFAKFLPSTLVGQIVASGEAPRLGGQEREATILFTDLRGYSTIVETADPSRVVDLLCEYFDAMASIIRAHEGNVIEYIGDAILAVFGAPSDVADHRAKATVCALKMRDALGQLNTGWNTRSISAVWQTVGFDDLSARTGLHTGRVIAGNMGSRDSMRYGIVGDPVNVAARLETLNKELDTTILVSAEVYAGLPPELAARATDAGCHVLKGRAKPQQVYSF